MRLRISVGREEAGVLEIDDQDRFTLTYAEDATSPVSLTLPVREKSYLDHECRSFFLNLLPEGAWRTALCHQLGLSESDHGGLLRVIGRDCAGAISLHDEPAEPSAWHYEPLAPEELKKWVRNPPARPSLRLEDGLRLSLAGAQDKLLLYLDEEGCPHLCKNGAPSNLILKPDIVAPLLDVELTAFNELLVMRLAADVGISCAEPIWLAGAYGSRRYDRAGQERLAQEDFSQLLGKAPAQKYSVTWKDCFDVVDRHATVPAKARLQLIERLLFSLFIGNHDAHGKNYSLLRTASGKVVLSPAYDLLCTAIYSGLSPHLAMPIGRTKDPSALRSEDWKSLCEEARIGLPYVKRRGRELYDKMSQALYGLEARVVESFPEIKSDVYPLRRRTHLAQRIRSHVKNQRKHGWGLI